MTEHRAPELATANALIQSFQHVLQARGDVALALLFGSRARGDASETSDVDLALLAPSADLLEIGARLSQVSGLEVDVISLADPGYRSSTSCCAMPSCCTKRGQGPTPVGVHTCSPISSSIDRGTSACATHGSKKLHSAACDGQPQLAFVEACRAGFSREQASVTRCGVGRGADCES